MKTAIVAPNQFAPSLFAQFDIDRLKEYGDVSLTYFDEIDEQGLTHAVKGVDAAISSWETPAFTANVLDAAPDMKIIAHAAGSVKPVVTDAVWDRGVIVTSSAAAISIGVAETTLCFFLMAGKRMPWLVNDVRKGGWQDPAIMSQMKESFRAVVGLIGCGNVGGELIRLLKNFEVEILLSDPYKTAEQAKELGVRKVELDELLSTSDFVCMTAPLTDETRGSFGKEQLSLIKDNAVLINTARAAIFKEDELIEELQKGRFVACIDVTDPQEPPPADHPLRKLDNVFLTPHIAGSAANNLLRVGAMAVDEVINCFTSQPYNYPIKKEMLATIG